MPARKIRPSRYSVTGYVATTKAERSQDAESSLEHDFLKLLEYDRRVERFLAQPFTIRWTDAEGKRRRYTPDVIVKYSFSSTQDDPHLRTTVYEVKPTAVLAAEWRNLKPKFRAAIGWAKEYGCRFHLVTEKEIRTPYLTNVKFLLAYRSRYLQDRHDLVVTRQRAIRETLYKIQRSTPAELLNLITKERGLQAELIPWIWNLIVQELIGADLTQRLTMTSSIWSLETSTSIKT